MFEALDVYIMEVKNYAHKITSYKKEGKWFVRIDRILSDGSLNYLNDHELPECTSENKWNLFEETMAVVGKTVGIDSPGVREHFKVMED